MKTFEEYMEGKASISEIVQGDLPEEGKVEILKDIYWLEDDEDEDGTNYVVELQERKILKDLRTQMFSGMSLENYLAEYGLSRGNTRGMPWDDVAKAQVKVARKFVKDYESIEAKVRKSSPNKATPGTYKFLTATDMFGKLCMGIKVGRKWLQLSAYLIEKYIKEKAINIIRK